MSVVESASAMTNEEYHASDDLSSSQIASYVEDPLQWYHWYVAKDWKRAPTKAMRFGTSVHDMVEHSLPLMVKSGGWDNIVREIPASVLNADGHCKGKAWTDWQKENPAEVYFKPWEQNPLRVVWDNLMANSGIRDFIAASRKEVSHHWIEDGIGPCKIKLDAVDGAVFCDWKTTCKKTKREFEAEIVRRGYDLRLAFYRWGYRDLFNAEPTIYIVAINTSGGYQVKPYRMPSCWLDDAEARLILTIDEMHRFDLASFLDAEIQQLEQPNYSKVNLDELDD